MKSCFSFCHSMLVFSRVAERLSVLLYEFLATVKAASHECVVRTDQP